MKKIILVVLLVSSFAHAQQSVDPKEIGPFEKGRIVSQETSGIIDEVITDLKTGCQYGLQRGPGPYFVFSLGCSDGYIDPKFKK